MKLFFMVLARDKEHVMEKIQELRKLGVPYTIICGERLNCPNVIYRAPKGKYDAINFGERFIPEDIDIVVLNDVDTRIHNFCILSQYFKSEKVALTFATEWVRTGPQKTFYRILNPLRKKIPVAASGELMMIRRDVLKRLLPLKPCKAEDTYILFKVLENGYKAIFSEECYAETERTKTPEKEEIYKRKTVTGIYQALSYSKPPFMIRVFYILLPLTSPLLLIFGKKGHYWMRGILLGFIDYMRGDHSGFWQPTYMD
jgi:cellulose synthase/poly-beta-1,6-N-acetylglucosamine synthase-like glycosyltransferase